MRNEVTVVTDDLNGEEGADTILFAIDGRAYQIDLGEKNADEMREAFARYIEAGRPIGRGTGLPIPAQSKLGNTNRTDPAFLKRLREWADLEGVQIGTRGRIPKSVIEQYRAQGGR